MRKGLRNAALSPAIVNAYMNAKIIMEIDLSFNSLDTGTGLDHFSNLETLILDHNSFT